MTTPLDTSTLVVLGESLAAGLVNFSLQADDQRRAFPQVVARQLGAPLTTAFFQPPGIFGAAGFPELPVLLPFEGRITEADDRSAVTPYCNLSVPGLTLAEALGVSAPPLVRADDPRQAAIRFGFGAGAAPQGGGTGTATPLELALSRRPTLAIVELGFAEAMQAAVSGRPEMIPSADTFRANYTRIVAALRAAGCNVVVTTVPDPMDTPACGTIDAAARVLRMPVAELQRTYGLHSGDRLLVDGLVEIGVQIMSKRPAALPPGLTIDAAAASAIGARVASLNAAIAAIAQEHNAAVADLAQLYRLVRLEGIKAGARTLTGDFLGGFFSLNGYTPGATGQAALANVVLAAIGSAAAEPVRAVDLASVVAGDAVADYRPAEGPAFRTGAGRLAAARATLKLMMFLVGFVAKAVAGAVARKKEKRPPEQGNDPSRWSLALPPGLVQVLPIASDASYYGDALRPVHSTVAEEVAFGITGKLLFGGLALLDSHLHGKVRIRFYPPVNNIAHFEVTHPGGGLSADDGRLTAPLFFKLAAVQHKVMDSTSEISSGDLNLITGEVSNLHYTLFFLNSAILSLAAANPALPKDPLAFPGRWGSTWARFDQRPDGLLDYTCYGTSFVPLSVLKAPVRFPLPFTGPSGSVASIPADGTSLHPHFRISTRPIATAPGAARALPTNTIRTIESARRRWQIQFGEHFGETVSIAVQPLPDAGELAARASAPAADPANDDRLNLPIGAVDLKAGTIMPGGGSRLPPLRWDGASLVVDDRAEAISGV